MNFLTNVLTSRSVARPLLFLRANSGATPLNKQRGFIQYERDADGYRNATDRISDWSEINTDPADRNPAERKRQAARCMDCGTPFCFTYTGCPINNPIPQFNNLVFEDQWREAAAQLFSTNNFPEFTGRVCPAPCEGACISGIVEDPVTIKDIEYSIVDRAFREGWVKPRVPQHRSGRRVAVVGSGPTGLAAADMLNQAGHTVRVLERADVIGGLLQYGIPNMKLDKRTVLRRVKLLELEGIEFQAGCHVGVDFDSGDLLRDFDSVVLAMGSTVPRDLEIPGRHLEGVHFAMDFLTENQKSLRYGGENGQEDPVLDVGWKSDVNDVCGHIHAGGKHVVVVGGGDTGTDCIGTSVRHGAISVTNMELLERPPNERAENNPWPEWPRVFSVDYGHAEVLARDGEEPRKFSMVSKR
jgi:NAD(P)H-dependent glutamate synthase small subunit